MKRFFLLDIKEHHLHILALILRICIGIFMMTHGYPKLMKLMAGGEIKFADPIGMGPGFSLFLTVFAEFLCSLLIILGLGTRLAAIPLMITMLVAAFIVHGADPFGRKELALVYLLMYGVLIVIGSGKYSLDYLLFKEKA